LEKGVTEHSSVANPVTLEEAFCPVCGAEGALRFVQCDLYCGLGGVFGQRYCSECHVFFLSPRVPKSKIDYYYPDSYGPYRADNHPRLIRKLAWALGLAQRKRRIVEKFVQCGRILDVGCGNGFFLRTLEGRPWERYAMDVKSHGTVNFPGVFYEGQFDNQRPPLSDLDAITLWHVFEHLYIPEKALEHAAAMLKPSGFLFLAIPDLKNIERHIFGKYWVGWDPPRHIATYSSLAIETLLGRSGFQLIQVVPDVCTGELFLLNVELLLRSRGFRPNVHHSIFLRILLSPLTYSLTRLGLAPAKVYVAQLCSRTDENRATRTS
jgi:SAM-dependent methyltransferase